MISRRSIPNSVVIYKNSQQISKEDLVTESNKWSESQINLIKKIIKQGGHAVIKGNRYHFTESLDSPDQPGDTFIEIKVEEDENSEE